MSDARRLRKVFLLVSLLVDLPIRGLPAAGLLALSPDGPPPGAVSNVPGDGGLRRPFPAIAERADNRSTRSAGRAGTAALLRPGAVRRQRPVVRDLPPPRPRSRRRPRAEHGPRRKGPGAGARGRDADPAQRAHGVERRLQPPAVLGRPRARPRGPGPLPDHLQGRDGPEPRRARARARGHPGVRASLRRGLRRQGRLGRHVRERDPRHRRVRAHARHRRLALRPLPDGRRGRARLPPSAAASPSSARSRPAASSATASRRSRTRTSR